MMLCCWLFCLLGSASIYVVILVLFVIKKKAQLIVKIIKNSNLNFDLNINIFVVVNLRTAKFFSTVDCADRKSANTTRRKHGEISQR